MFGSALFAKTLLALTTIAVGFLFGTGTPVYPNQ